MKTMTCKELGGICDAKLTAASWDEMVMTMTKYVMEKHPDVAKQMEKMHNEDPKRWGREMKPKWNAASEAGGVTLEALCHSGPKSLHPTLRKDAKDGAPELFVG